MNRGWDGNAGGGWNCQWQGTKEEEDSETERRRDGGRETGQIEIEEDCSLECHER